MATNVISSSASIIYRPSKATRVVGSSASIIYKPLPTKQRKGNITIIQTEDIMREPNAYNIAVYADRTMEAGETLWQHTIPQNIAVLANAPLSTGVLAVPATSPIQIDVSKSGSLLGSFNWAIGETDATITWGNSVGLFVDEEVVFTVVQTDRKATDITINLIGVHT